LDIQHMKTVKQLYATDITKTTKLTMRLVTIHPCLFLRKVKSEIWNIHYIHSINARRVTTKNINET